MFGTGSRTDPEPSGFGRERVSLDLEVLDAVDRWHHRRGIGAGTVLRNGRRRAVNEDLRRPSSASVDAPIGEDEGVVPEILAWRHSRRKRREGERVTSIQRQLAKLALFHDPAQLTALGLEERSGPDHFDDLGHRAKFQFGSQVDRFCDLNDQPGPLMLAEALGGNGKRIRAGPDRDEAGDPLFIGLRAEAPLGGFVRQLDAGTGNRPAALVENVNHDGACRDLGGKTRSSEATRKVEGC